MNKNEFFEIIEQKETLDMLARYAFFISRNKEKAEDIAQDTLVKAISAFKNFDGKNINGWLKVMCRNRFIDTIRKKSEKLKGDVNDPDPDGIDPLDPEKMTEYRILLDIINELDPPKPEIIKQTFLGKSQEEISKYLKIGRSSVSEKLTEARAELAKIYGVEWQMN